MQSAVSVGDLIEIIEHGHRHEGAFGTVALVADVGGCPHVGFRVCGAAFIAPVTSVRRHASSDAAKSNTTVAADAGTAVLALDLATTTGWAIADGAAVTAWPVNTLGSTGPVDGVQYGSICFKAGDRGKLFLDFSRWLDELIASQGISRVFVEAPVHQRTIAHARIGMALAGIVDLVTRFRGIECQDAAPSTIKLHFCGHGHAEKKTIMAECDRRGWLPEDNNAGDALAILDWGIHVLRGGWKAAPKRPKTKRKRTTTAAAPATARKRRA